LIQVAAVAMDLERSRPAQVLFAACGRDHGREEIVYSRKSNGVGGGGIGGSETG
jgi:hypothetical protein